MNTTALTLDALITRTGIEVFDYLERSITIPVTDQPQAQGDLIVVPSEMLAREVTERHPEPGSMSYAPPGWFSTTRDVGPTGIEVLRSAAGGNPHTLVADPGTCTWTTGVVDIRGLALGIMANTASAYLIHPEHGASGIAPGRYVIRRQRELGFAGGGVMLVAD